MYYSNMYSYPQKHKHLGTLALYILRSYGTENAQKADLKLAFWSILAFSAFFMVKRGL